MYGTPPPEFVSNADEPDEMPLRDVANELLHNSDGEDGLVRGASDMRSHLDEALLRRAFAAAAVDAWHAALRGLEADWARRELAAERHTAHHYYEMADTLCHVGRFAEAWQLVGKARAKRLVLQPVQYRLLMRQFYEGGHAHLTEQLYAAAADDVPDALAQDARFAALLAEARRARRVMRWLPRWLARFVVPVPASRRR